jgi:signal transduction histidine kinase
MSEFISPASDPHRCDLGDFVHDLNNALAPIIMSVELLRRKVADPDAQRQLDLLAGHAWRGAAIVRRILALSETRAGLRFRAGGKRAARTRRR